jgi:hypothetical protein
LQYAATLAEKTHDSSARIAVLMQIGRFEPLFEILAEKRGISCARMVV